MYCVARFAVTEKKCWFWWTPYSSWYGAGPMPPTRTTRPPPSLRRNRTASSSGPAPIHRAFTHRERTQIPHVRRVDGRGEASVPCSAPIRWITVAHRPIHQESAAAPSPRRGPPSSLVRADPYKPQVGFWCRVAPDLLPSRSRPFAFAFASGPRYFSHAPRVASGVSTVTSFAAFQIKKSFAAFGRVGPWCCSGARAMHELVPRRLAH